MRRFLRQFILLCLTASACPMSLLAQQQFSGLCAPVNLVLSQNLTLERIGFQATLKITDNDPNNPITGFAANLTFENPALTTNGVINDSSTLFFVQPPQFQNISDISGNGVIQPGQTATITWFIIPTVKAGGTTPFGTQYSVGANLSGQINGVTIPASSMLVLPSQITVQPDAQLQITYFQPRDVTGMDPFTGLGAPIPFSFGVLVQNVGYGAAQNVIIDSQQPKIAQNTNSLPLVAQLLGSRVKDAPLLNPSLSVNIGALQPNQTTEASWDMVVSISGTFLSVAATYTHSSALGGSETSLIKSVNAYLMLHQVLDDAPGRDNVRDFLADVAGTLDPVANLIPDSLYESDGGVFPVTTITNGSLTQLSNAWQIAVSPTNAGWTYFRLPDPNQSKLPLVAITRSDGKILNTNNFWTSIHFEPTNNLKDTYLNVFDFVGSSSYTYNVSYTNTTANTNPPVTTLQFAGPSLYSGGVYYISPQTQVSFLSQDVNPVTTYSSLNGASFAVAVPFTLNVPGAYQLSFYGRDSGGNQETTHNATLVVQGPGSLGFTAVNIGSQPIFNSGGALSVRPGATPITFQQISNAIAVNAQVDIFQGVAGWATISNTPSSPTRSTSASLVVGGQNVDFYIYQLNGGAWSAESPVSAPLVLSGLLPGTNTISVLGRSQYGAYLDPSNALTVTWVVDSNAPATLITGAPATPAASTSARLSIGGASITNYQWTVDNGFYQLPTNTTIPVVLSNLSFGPHVVSVLGEAGGVFQSNNVPTTASWVVNPLYGYDLSSLPGVLSLGYTNIGNGPVSFNWNGLGAVGAIEPPGWYTVRITTADGLGNTNFFVGLTQIGSVSGVANVVADVTRGAINPRARGRWAVWQDQSDGNWEIYARDMSINNAPISQITHTSLSQQNPRTDGRYAVWQGQQINGSWDVFIDDLSGTAGPQALTSTSTVDEINPAIDWPWVVFETRATGSKSAPWLLVATNLLNGQSFLVSPSTQNELDPAVQAGRLVWQDFRDQGPGEIYFCDLESQQVRRITTNIFGQFNPAIEGNWIVWADNRKTQVDIYGFDLLRNAEIRITSTPQDESQPVLDGEWLCCMQSSLDAQSANAMLVHLPSLLAVPLTGTPTLKTLPALVNGALVWQEAISNQSRIVSASLPALEPVFQNRNVVLVTPSMVSNVPNAFTLLSLWASNGVESITEYTSLAPQVVSQTASISNGVVSGQNFSLAAGNFLWMRFNGQQVLDLGLNNASPVNLAAGNNVFGYTQFPHAYSAFQFLRQLGLNNVPSVRMLDAESGRWRVALVQAGGLAGDDFPIPATAVLMLNLANPVNQFTPQPP